MTPSVFDSLRATVTQASQLAVADQLAFVEAANTLSLRWDPISNGEAASEAHRTARKALEHLWGEEPLSDPSGLRVRWTRWRDGTDRSGVGVLLSGPKDRYIVLPSPNDLDLLSLSEDVAGPRIEIIPNEGTLQRSRDSRLAYLRIQDLLAQPFEDGDRGRFERFRRARPQAAPRLVPLASVFTGRGQPRHYLEEREDVYRAVRGLQQGMYFLLASTVGRGASVPNGATTIESVYRLFPDPTNVEAPPETLRPARFFGGGHPRLKRVEVEVQGTLDLVGADGEKIGEAHICAGGLSGKTTIAEIGLSAETSSGHMLHQEDGYYVCRFQLPNRPPVTVMVGADGIGGAEMGEMASSAALQGIHAAVVEAVAEGRIPLAHDLFEAASQALQAQIGFHEAEIGKKFEGQTVPNSVASVTVVVGNTAFIATAGDFMTAHMGPRGPEPLRALGFSNLDVDPQGYVLRTVLQNNPVLYATTLKAGDWLLSGSDGFWRNLVGEFKAYGSWLIRQQTGSSRPEQNLFHNPRQVLAGVPDLMSRGEAASALHAIAYGEYDEAAYPALAEIETELDNLTVLALSIGEDAHKPDFEVPRAYKPLEPVQSAFHFT